MSESPIGFCIDCGFGVASFEGLKCCPNCGSKSVPASAKDQVTVSVNWHELRCLTMWAERWAQQHALGNTVYAIARRLKAQHPSRTPLTFAGEIVELRREHTATTTDGDVNEAVQRFENEDEAL